MYECRNHPLLSRAKFARRVARHLLLALFVIGIALGIGVLGYHCIGGLRIPLHWRLELGRLPSERFHDFGRDGPGRSASLDCGEAFRFVLRVIFGTGIHRHRITHARPICAPAFAPLSRRREMKMPQLLTY